MDTDTHVFVFDDQKDETLDSYGLLFGYDGRNKSLLHEFLQKTYQEIRIQLEESGHYEQFGRFSSFQNLVSLHNDCLIHHSLTPALTCAYQIGAFIRDSGEFGHLYSRQSGRYLLGFGTGALTASAISCATNTHDLIPVAVKTIGLLVRFGVKIHEVGISISGNIANGLNSWLLNISNTSAADGRRALDSFLNEVSLPVLSQPFITEIGESHVSVGGLPSTLEILRATQFSGKATWIDKVHAPCHTSTIFGQSEVSEILGPIFLHEKRDSVSNVPIMSGTTGMFLSGRNFPELIQQSLEDILFSPIDRVKAISGIAYLSSFSKNRSITIHASALTSQTAIVDSLESEGHNVNGFAQSTQESRKTSSSGFKQKLAIVGMSGRFPEAEDPDEFWNLLYCGLDVHKTVPEIRWDINTHVDVTLKRKNTSGTTFGNWLNHPGEFDRKFFNMSPRETPQVDPQSRLALMTAYEAMEQAGMVPGSTPSTRRDRVGVFYGSTSNDWMENNSSQDIDTYFIAGGCRAFIPGRINYCFKLSGPSLSIDTACSSSLAAIHAACNSIWQGDCDSAIAGGTNILTNPDYTAGLDRGHFLSRTGNCKSFDDLADGYCRGEGVVSIIIKSLEDAIKEKDPILGIIAGASTNHSAEAASITRPHTGAQRAIFKTILNDANVHENDISYVEMHGTGTQVGDSTEMDSVLETFASDRSLRPRPNHQPLYLGSVKANVGHGEGVAGATSLAKVLLMLKNSSIPPHVGIKNKINTKFPANFKERNVHIATSGVHWARPGGGVRRAFINNFSAAGGNSALLIEDGPIRTKSRGVDPRTEHIVTVSAKTVFSFEKNLEALLSWLKSSSESSINLPALAYTTTARRTHFRYRAILVGSNISQIKQEAKKAFENTQNPPLSKGGANVTFAFSGNGNQYIGMGRQLFETLPSFHSEISRLDHIVQQQGFPSIIDVITAPEGNVDTLLPTTLQLATVCLEVALARVWISWGITPSLVVGHSLGEFAALCIAGVLSDSDTIYLVGCRAQLLEAKCEPGTRAMLVVSASVARTHSNLQGIEYEVSCLNAPDSTVISGTLEMISKAQATLKVAKPRIKCTLLSSCPYAFHSSQVDPILAELESVGNSVQFLSPKIPVLSPLLSRIIKENGIFGPKYLADHCRKPVNMVGALFAAKKNGALREGGLVLEIGPHPCFHGMIEPSLSAEISVLPTLRRNQDAWESLNAAISKIYLAGVDINWKAFHSGYEVSHEVLELPRYRWDLENYWIQYVNDWNLRKGDPLPETAPHVSIATPKSDLETLKTKTKFVTPPKSSTIQRIIEDKLLDGKIYISSEADLSSPELSALAQGHKVNQIPLATPSIYADIVLTLVTYMIERYKPQDLGCVIEISSLTIEHALVAHGKLVPQLFTTELSMDADSEFATARFSNGQSKNKAVQYAYCKVYFHNSSTPKPSFSFSVENAVSRIRDLRDGLTNGTSTRFNNSMIYRMVATLAQFDPHLYQAVTEIILDSTAMEASSVVSFSKVKIEEGQEFHTHPAFIDAITQSAGFVMNANDHSNLDVEVFVNHGWKNFRLYERLDKDSTYETLVKMTQGGGATWEGDLVVIKAGRIVASFQGIVLQGVPKKVLLYILTKEKEKMDRLLMKDSTTKISPSTVTVHAVPLTTASKLKEKSAHSNIELPQIKLQVQQTLEETDLIRKAMDIISEESGLPSSELGDSCYFMDVGIDSLLTLQILSRLQDELNLDIDTNAFNSLDTIKSFKSFIDTSYAKKQIISSSNPLQIIAQVPLKNSIVVESGVLESLPSELSLSLEIQSKEQNNIRKTIAQSLQIISEEVGIPISELTDDIVFADIGIDSLLSLSISARFQEELDLGDLKTDDMLFHAPTVRDFKGMLGLAPKEITPDGTIQSSMDDKFTPPLTPTKFESSSEAPEPIPMKKRQTPRASSVLLRGRPQNASKTLFLFPDGSGSATSYVNTPSLGDSICVIALNCPYLHTPEDMTCTLDELMEAYLVEVRRRQSVGPYNFGGWSCGGILAYRATQLMIQDGESVESLSLIDAPVPKGLDALPVRWYDHCAKHGVFREMFSGPSTASSTPRPVPDWLIPHFRANVNVLKNYYADPLPVGFCPRTSILWAPECVTDGTKFPRFHRLPSDPEGIKFLTDKRVDFTAGEWVELFPGSTIEVDTIAGANHFSMMGPGNSANIGRFLSRSMR